MNRWLREIRLLPVVLLAAALLLILKATGLVLNGGYIFAPNDADSVTVTNIPANDPSDDPVVVGSIKQSDKDESADLPRVLVETAATAAAANKKSWAHEMFNFPDVTGSVGPSERKPPPATKVAAKAPTKGKEKGIPLDPRQDPADMRTISPAERAILERLQQRREQLEARARALDMRESLIQAAEKRLEGRVNELKSVEGRIHVAKTEKRAADAARFQDLVTMYENMKAKDAARIFDRLNMQVLVEVASQINPRRMADILAQMTPEIAERLTIEFASRANGQKPPVPMQLPKIQGRPNSS
jgi:flagellar motility protein MotE (MotC chaperone)